MGLDLGSSTKKKLETNTQPTDLPEWLDPAFEDVEVRMRLEVPWPDEVAVQRPELLASRKGTDEMKVLVEGLLKISVQKQGQFLCSA